MKFEKLFKKPFATQTNLKKWEDAFFDILHENKEWYFPKNREPAVALEGQDTLVEINDSERENWIVSTIHRKTIFGFKEKSKIFINNYEPNRILDAFKIYEGISSLFTIDESAPKLKQAFHSQDLDLVFNLLTKNQYDISMPFDKTIAQKTLYTIKNERESNNG